jgi:hypothetical protein
VQDETQQKTSTSVGKETAQERDSNRRNEQEDSEHSTTQHKLVGVRSIAKIDIISKRHLHSFRTSGLFFAALPLWPRLGVGNRLSFRLGFVVSVHHLTGASGPIVKCEYRTAIP